MHINYIKAAKTNFRQIFQKKYEGFNLVCICLEPFWALFVYLLNQKWFLEAVAQKKKRDSNMFDLSCS